jgi:hypothetical protein
LAASRTLLVDDVIQLYYMHDIDQRRPTMTPNEANAKAQKLFTADPALLAGAKDAWVRVCDAIEARALKARPLPKAYEVRHETDTARAAFLTAIANGETPRAAEAAAKTRVKL